jgi:hypothetical protein
VHAAKFGAFFAYIWCDRKIRRESAPKQIK